MSLEDSAGLREPKPDFEANPAEHKYGNDHADHEPWVLHHNLNIGRPSPRSNLAWASVPAMSPDGGVVAVDGPDRTL
jgi:hypothetical protein